MYWVWKANVHSAVQVERWDNTILELPLSGHWARNVRVSWGIPVKWAHWTTGHTDVKLAILSKMFKNKIFEK